MLKIWPGISASVIFRGYLNSASVIWIYPRNYRGFRPLCYTLLFDAWQISAAILSQFALLYITFFRFRCFTWCGRISKFDSVQKFCLEQESNDGQTPQLFRPPTPDKAGNMKKFETNRNISFSYYIEKNIHAKISNFSNVACYSLWCACVGDACDPACRIAWNRVCDDRRNAWNAHYEFINE